MRRSVSPEQAKLNRLRDVVRSTGTLAVAFSGGVDSTFLAAVAQRELGDRALAITAFSPVQARREQEDAARIARDIGIRHVIFTCDAIDREYFRDNPPDRCYHCKRDLFHRMREVAREHGFELVADGTTTDDLSDVRPGHRALKELGVLSPLLEAGLTKAEIRSLSRQMGLPTADKPAMACLASRIPFGEPVTREKLSAVESVEEALRALGFAQVRARHHGDTVRIEVEAEHIARLCSDPVRSQAAAAGRAAGFRFVAADLDGYRTGNLNPSPPAPPASDR